MLHGFGSFVYVFIILLLLCLHEDKLQYYCYAKLVSSSCDLFQYGSWVFEETYPLYNTSGCPFVEKEFDCQKNGRADNHYLKLRWKPNACALPRFNGQDLLRRLKGKRILFVGDSLSLNQWMSLTCMLHAAVPQTKYTLTRTGDISTFSLPDYDVSVVVSRNAFLVDLVDTKVGRLLKLDSIQNGKAWKGYHILIFNTWHWWLHKGSKQPWEYIEAGGKIVKDMDRLAAYREGLTTWSKWVDSNVDATQTKVFFQGISPTHYDGKEWDDSNSKSATCNGQTQAESGSTYPAGSPPAAAVVHHVLTAMSSPVTLLDITLLSQLRKDGHPSVYGFGGKKGNDCSHWCLPGVPDTWNELFYAALVATG